MSKSNLHGGDLDEISRIYNIDKESIINFSGNVNPLGLPESVKNAIAKNVDICVNYPDVAYKELREAIAYYVGENYDNVIVGNGSTELITGFIKYSKPKNAIIISPAYSEYLKAIEAVGGKANLFELSEEQDFILDVNRLTEAITENTDLVVICNPNNPTGSFVTESQMDIILNHCSKYSVKVMVDETYCEFSDSDISSIPLVKKYNNLFVIRGTSKFFACPGLRLGYGICSNNDALEYINSHKDLWSVNVFAELAGKIMFTDKKFITKTRELIKTERMRIIKELGSVKELKLYNTQSNFFLVKILKDSVNSDHIFNQLIKEGILIRNCKDFPYLSDRFIRFCILDKKHNTKLINSLIKILRG